MYPEYSHWHTSCVAVQSDGRYIYRTMSGGGTTSASLAKVEGLPVDTVYCLFDSSGRQYILHMMPSGAAKFLLHKDYWT